MTEPQTTATTSRTSRNLLLAALLLLALIAGAAWLWNVPGSATAAAPEPFDLTRNADGSWPAIPVKDPAFSLSFEATKRQSSVNHSTSSWNASAASARFAGRSFAVIAMSDNALTDLVALRLIAKLQADSEVRRIRYRPQGHAGEPGEAAPDIVITIEVRKQRDDSLVGNGGMSAECVVTAGDQLAHSIHHKISDKQAPHVVQFGSRTTATVAIQQNGIATPNARLAATANDLANAITKDLGDSFDKLRSDKGEFPDLPAAFTSEYRPVDSLQFAIADIYGITNKPKQLASWHGRLIHNQTWWRGSVPHTRADASLAITKQMVEAGWQAEEQSLDVELAFTKGLLEVAVLYSHPRGGIGATMVGEPETPPGQSPSTDVFVRYLERANDETRHRAAESLFSDDVSPAALMVCSPMWSKSQHERGRAIIDARQLWRPSDLLQRSYLRERAGDRGGMIADLRRAHWLAKAGFEDQEAVENAVTKAKKLDTDIETADVGWLAKNGFRTLQPGDAIEAEVTREDPIRLVFPRGDKTAVVLSLIHIWTLPTSDLV